MSSKNILDSSVAINELLKQLSKLSSESALDRKAVDLTKGMQSKIVKEKKKQEERNINRKNNNDLQGNVNLDHTNLFHGDTIQRKQELKENNIKQQDNIHLDRSKMYEHNLRDEALSVHGETALNKFYESKSWDNLHEIVNSPSLFYKTIVGNGMITHIQNKLADNNIKIKLTVRGIFKKPVDGHLTFAHIPVKSDYSIIKPSTDINETLNDMINEIQELIEIIHVRGSGWIIDDIKQMIIESFIYKPYKGSSYIELPDELKNKKACLNIKNKDSKCLMYSILAGLHPVDRKLKDMNAPTSYIEHESKYNFGCIDYPAENSDNVYKKLENHNPFYLSVYLARKHIHKHTDYKNNEKGD